MISGNSRKFEGRIGPAPTIKTVVLLAIVPAILALSSIAYPQFADLVVVNANVRTLDSRSSRAESVAVTNGRFTFVGSESDARKLIGPKTEVVDAEQETLLPGFNDSHVHLMNVGQQFFVVDLRNSANPEESLNRIRRVARFLPDGAWITGSGWTDSNLPNRADLDAATPDHPLFIYGSDTNSAIVNSAAIKLAGIVRTSGPKVERAELAQVRKFVPTTPSKLDIINAALRYAAAFGVTSIQDVSSDDLSDELRELEKQGKLTARIYDCVGIDKPLPKIDRNPDSMIRTGCIKHVSEGEPEEIPELTKRLAVADRAGVQVLIHAIGSRSNDVVLTIFENIARQNGRRDRRLRVEHAQGFRDKDLMRFARIPAIASMQPALFANGRDDYAEVFAKLRNANVRLAFGSDAAMIPIDPLEGIRDALGADPKRFLSEDEALRAYTLGSAYAEFQEKDKGTIEVGKLADFVIVDQMSEIYSTFVGGRLVYRRSDPRKSS